ncbi:MAG: hypothetical protein IPO52_15465 [Gemmatimonadetes bacterium]|nr:hypothetical protein [Gemmatimonadota bacterium]
MTRHVDLLTTAERWKVVGESAKEVGPALFFSLLIITVSFLPVFALEGQEGRLFRPWPSPRRSRWPRRACCQ